MSAAPDMRPHWDPAKLTPDQAEVVRVAKARIAFSNGVRASRLSPADSMAVVREVASELGVSL